MNEEFHYSGSELEFFQDAVNWKETLRTHIHPFVSGDVLEVGAGIGGTTRVLRTGLENSWTCLEPDIAMASSIQKEFTSVKVIAGTLETISSELLFDSILYVDVLEHIEKDLDEIRIAIRHLKGGGHLVVLVPAHQWLYSRFDAAIGHYRRYSRKSMELLTQPGMQQAKIIYLDSAGLLASMANKLLLSQDHPSPGQIRFWDEYLVKTSKYLDPFFRYKICKSLLAVWQLESSIS
jgi:SAM-dependent methyltransferase